jgi:hypothetical protein
VHYKNKLKPCNEHIDDFVLPQTNSDVINKVLEHYLIMFNLLKITSVLENFETDCFLDSFSLITSRLFIYKL